MGDLTVTRANTSLWLGVSMHHWQLTAIVPWRG